MYEQESAPNEYGGKQEPPPGGGYLPTPPNPERFNWLTWVGYVFIGLLLLIAGFVIRGCTGDGGGTGPEVEVTRIIETEDEVTREVEVEVTRVVGEVEVTRIVTAEVPIT